MSEPTLTRRAVIGAAGAAAVSFTVPVASTASEVTAPDAPRLPLNVLLRAGLSDDHLHRVREISPQINAGRHFDLADADVILGNVSRDELKRATRLRWLHCPSAGVEHLLNDDFVASDVLLTNAQGCYGPEIAEHAFALLFALTRGIAQQVRQMREHAWGHRDHSPLELRGMAMGIIGLGGIGREIARRAKAMDMKVIAVDAEPLYAERYAMVDEIRLVDDGLTDLLSRADVVACCCPSTPKSRGMIGSEQLAAMKRGAYLINVARGKLVKTDALLEALKTGHLAGAGLDVTDPEPLPGDHPLWDLPNVVITSHIAGRSQFGWERVQNVFVENLARFVRSQPLLNLVDKEKGY